MYAAAGGHIEIVKLLLEQKGIYVNLRDVYLFNLIYF